jgi:hypothetical protein
MTKALSFNKLVAISAIGGGLEMYDFRVRGELIKNTHRKAEIRPLSDGGE